MVLTVQIKWGSASERAKGRGAFWETSGHAAKYCYRMSLAWLGIPLLLLLLLVLLLLLLMLLLLLLLLLLLIPP